jgi:multiple sugar transport system permease protein
MTQSITRSTVRPIWNTSRKTADRIKKSITYILLVFVVLIVWVPFMWAIAASFSPLEKVFVNAVPFTWKALFPVNFTVQPYLDLFQKFGFASALKNTLILSIGTVVLGGLSSAMAGFAFARFNFKGKGLLFGITLFTFMVPVEVIIIPMYIMMTELGWMNTWAALLLPGLANGLTIFLFRQFFAELPQEIIDAARVDGASWTRIFFQIVIPISKPVLITGALVLFLGAWNSFFWPLTVTSGQNMRVVQLAVAYTVGDHGVVVWNVRMAGSMLASIVPILVLMPFQKYYVRGIANTGLGGQ